MRRLTQGEYIERATEKHNGKYNYSNVIYTGKRNKIDIICPIHGLFKQNAGHHLRGQGCPECGKEYASEWRQNDFKSFIEESDKRFDKGYSFPLIEIEYKNSHSKITCLCNKCGNSFIKIAGDHLTSPHGGCRKCYANRSKQEENLIDFISKIVGEENIIIGDRNILNGQEIDIYLPKFKIGIEYNGLFWHNEDRKGTDYHLLKTEKCLKEGIRLVHIFEDEYVNNQTIVENKLKHILKCNNDLPKIYGRNCFIKEISSYQSKCFLERFNIQGYIASTIYYGAYYNEQLIAIMCFKIKKNNNWEMTRFASDYNYICCGVGGKLFKHFIREYNPTIVETFADRRWTIDNKINIYHQLGFEFDGYTPPNYTYIIGNECKRYHKFGFKKKINTHKIYDCGLLKYVWEKKC